MVPRFDEEMSLSYQVLHIGEEVAEENYDEQFLAYLPLFYVE
jgi:hypothetical protein